MVTISDVNEAFNLLSSDANLVSTWQRLDKFHSGNEVERIALMAEVHEYHKMELGAPEFLRDHLMDWERGDECPVCAAVVATHGLTPPGTEVREFLTNVPVKIMNPKFRLAYPGNDPENGHAHLLCINGHSPCDACGNVISEWEMMNGTRYLCGECHHEDEKLMIKEAFEAEFVRVLGIPALDVKVEMVKTCIEVGNAETGPMVDEGVAWQVTVGSEVFREKDRGEEQFTELAFTCGDITITLHELGIWF